MAEGKSWQARIGEATDALAQDFVESITYDNRLYRQDVAGSVAHARMLAKAGLITEDEETKIVAGLKAIEEDFAAGRISLDKSLEDIHMVVEAELIRRIGEPGRKLHTARSRNDQVALDLALWVRQSSLEIAKRLHDLCRAFVSMAQRSTPTWSCPRSRTCNARNRDRGGRPNAWRGARCSTAMRIVAPRPGI